MEHHLHLLRQVLQQLMVEQLRLQINNLAKGRLLKSFFFYIIGKSCKKYKNIWLVKKHIDKHMRAFCIVDVQQ